MVIAPGTNVRILKNCPLDTTYTHTIYFASASAQQAYFLGLTKHALSSFTYQRTTPTKLRVGVAAEALYDCNYLMWQNTSFGTKWFYAFIVSVEYINNQCSEITFEIDVIQTWLFDYHVQQTYVDRCHTGSDLIGENIQPESIEVGEYILNSYDDVEQLKQLTTVVAIAGDPTSDDGGGGTGDDDQDPDHGPGVEGGVTRATATAVHGSLYDNVYGGCTLYNYDLAVDVNSLLSEYVASPDAIVDIYTAPRFCAHNNEGPLDGNTPAMLAVHPGGVTTTQSLDGYIPHNCKLYTYPYNFLHVDNASGSSLALRYEFFGNSSDPVLFITGKVTQPIIVTLRPSNYKGSGSEHNMNEVLELKNYPQCSWSMDAYKVWVAQNKFEIASTVFNTLSSVGGAVVGGPAAMAGAAGRQLGEVQSLIGQAYKASIAADITRGTANGGNANCPSLKHTFYYGRASVSKNYAKMIDSYFDMFGYHVGDIRPYFPNARPHWTYIRTVGVNPTGSVPADDMKKICQIYDSGITWWMNGSEVGDYSLDNKAIVRG